MAEHDYTALFVFVTLYGVLHAVIVPQTVLCSHCGGPSPRDGFSML